MDYLIYIEHAAENLQFFLWLRDYTKRFSELPAGERALAAEWTLGKSEVEASNAQSPGGLPRKVAPETAAIFKGSDFANEGRSKTEEPNPFNTPPCTPGDMEKNSTAATTVVSDGSSTLKSSHPNFAEKAAGAFENADLKWQPCKS
jgi:hypothetical protein